MPRWLLLLLVLVMLTLGRPSSAGAGGSVSLDEIQRVLKQQPDLAAYLFSTLDFDGSG